MNLLQQLEAEQIADLGKEIPEFAPATRSAWATR